MRLAIDGSFVFVGSSMIIFDGMGMFDDGGSERLMEEKVVIVIVNCRSQWKSRGLCQAGFVSVIRRC